MIKETRYLFEGSNFIPFIVYGHSYGACCAYEFVRQLRYEGITLPMQLIVSGRLPPQLGVVDEPIHSLPEPELQQAMLDRYDTPIMTDKDLIELTLPPLRADLKALDEYLPDPYTSTDPPLDIPITILTGEKDKRVPFARVDEWRVHTTKKFNKIMVPGVGHWYSLNSFFLQFMNNAFRSTLDDIDEAGELLTAPHPEPVAKKGGEPLSSSPSSSPSSSSPASSSSSSRPVGIMGRRLAALHRGAPKAKAKAKAVVKQSEDDLEAYDLC